MRVLLTTDTVGGVWTFTKELSQGLLVEGHSVALVSLGGMPDADQRSWADRTIARAPDRFEYHPTLSPLEWMQDNVDAFRHSASLLERLARSFHADLIHSSQFCFGALATALPILITAHSDVLSWAEACQPGALADSPWLMRYKSLVQTGLTAADAVAAPTQGMLAALLGNFQVPSPSFVVSNGRTLDEVSTPERSASGSAFETWVPGKPTCHPVEPKGASFPSGRRRLQAVTAGRLWDEAKNLALLTQLTSPIPMLVAGEAPPGPVLPNLTFTGHLPERSLLERFSESAIYLCPSRYEPFGLAPLEAALCGCAVLANDLPTLREVWKEAALYFTDAPGLERLLVRLASDPDELAALQHRSRERAMHFTRSRMTAAYLERYRELLQSEESAHAA